MQQNLLTSSIVFWSKLAFQYYYSILVPTCDDVINNEGPKEWGMMGFSIGKAHLNLAKNLNQNTLMIENCTL